MVAGITSSRYIFSINMPQAVRPGPKARLTTSFPLGIVSSFTMACQIWGTVADAPSVIEQACRYR
uniref:Uncharacterized protein n=1 Tax=Candidatus Kentrum sp. LFY TaxID=2126342 RepID=A0A450V6P5_9GAMM|nr:MAG: hypothetical protein BECKLFY1418A_GA0070994_11176 [Candidatus Kentron sp. LFY]